MSPKLGYKRMVIISFIVLVLTVPIISINSKAQATQRLYLNRVGFCNIEVGYDIHVVGDYAYVTNNDGLMIIDVSDPTSPVKVGEVIVGGSFGIAVEGDLVYITSVSGGFIIANISDPTNPEQISQVTDGGGSYRIDVSGSYACVCYFNSGFKIFNISDPTDPGLLGEYSDNRSDDILIDGNYAYFANAQEGIKVISISDPTSPDLVAIIHQTGGANDMHITDDLLFVARWGNGIKVIDISNPSSPSTLDTYIDDDGGEELGLIEKDGLLYVADNYGIELFNVSNPTSIVEITQRTSDVEAAHDLDVDDDYIYVAQGGGLLILEIGTRSDTGDSDIIFYLIIILVVVALVATIISVVYFKILKPRKNLSEEL